ncbi:hypothetical protein KIN20_028719 [Parelaphostrongylus tenuis]|uniref:Uncharacterized protein n=1 Tax=Parelaphostrongylus tenuis TaxID=148309 RepID=A0AAD5R1D5_PARTN|nr:hypothetical protein KIN20_028719 [Parelaphostrongylus tenuis]
MACDISRVFAERNDLFMKKQYIRFSKQSTTMDDVLEKRIWRSVGGIVTQGFSGSILNHGFESILVNDLFNGQ